MEFCRKKEYKRSRVIEEDRISSLPDQLLHNILSRIKIKEAVQSCILSKRWTRVWSTLPYLNFDHINFCHDDKVSYANFVKDFISKRNHFSHVSTFALLLSEFNQELVEFIVNYAISHNVEEFSIDCGFKRRIKFVPWSFPVLTTLHLKNCANVPLMSWGLPCLTTLRLENVTFQKDQALRFEGFIHLQNLTLKWSIWWHGMEVLVISSRTLTNLTISQNYVEPRSCLFVISAPKLSCLDYSGNFPPSLSQPEGFPCLERVNIDIDIAAFKSNKYFTERKHEYTSQVLRMFQELRGVKFLTLSFSTIQVLSTNLDFSEYPPSPFTDLKCLTLDKRQFYSWNLDNPTNSLDHVIIYLLGTSPGAKILIQGWWSTIKNYNPKVNTLRWTGLNYSVVEPETISSDEGNKSGSEGGLDLSNAHEGWATGDKFNSPYDEGASDDEYSSSSSESYSTDDSSSCESYSTNEDESGKEIDNDLNVDANEERAEVYDGHIGDCGAEVTNVRDAMEELVECGSQQVPEMEADACKMTIMDIMARIHVNGTGNLSLWEGHNVDSEYVELLDYIKEKYPETFKHFDPQTEMIYTLGLNTLCASVSGFLEAMGTNNITTSIITHYRGLFADLERWGFNMNWLTTRLNNADDICAIDNSIDSTQAEELELQARLVACQKKLEEMQALRVAKRAKLLEI